MCVCLCLLLTKRIYGQILCKSCPVEFSSYFHYCQSLAFDQRPDYAFVKRLFRDLFNSQGILSNTMHGVSKFFFSIVLIPTSSSFFNRLWVWLCIRLDSFEIQTRPKTKGMSGFILCVFVLFFWIRVFVLCGGGADSMYWLHLYGCNFGHVIVLLGSRRVISCDWPC